MSAEHVCHQTHPHGTMCSFVVLFVILCTVFSNETVAKEDSSLCSIQGNSNGSQEISDCLQDLVSKYGTQKGEVDFTEFSQMVFNIGLGRMQKHTVEEQGMDLSPSGNDETTRKTERLQRDVTERSEGPIAPSSTLPSETHVDHRIDHHEHQNEHNTECLSPDSLFEILQQPTSGKLKFADLWLICPVLLQQLDSQVCVDRTPTTPEMKTFQLSPQSTTVEAHAEDLHLHVEGSSFTLNHSAEVWLYAICAITVISLASVACIITVPCVQRFPKAYYRLLAVLVALAVGTLAGDALLHLIPHAIIPHAHGEEEAEEAHSVTSSEALKMEKEIVLKSFTILAGIFLFFVFEQFLHSCNSGHSHGAEKFAPDSGNSVPRSPLFPPRQPNVGAKLCNHHHCHHHHTQLTAECVPMMVSPQPEFEGGTDAEKSGQMYLSANNSSTCHVHIHNDKEKEPINTSESSPPLLKGVKAEDSITSQCVECCIEDVCVECVNTHEESPPAVSFLKRLSVTGADTCGPKCTKVSLSCNDNDPQTVTKNNSGHSNSGANSNSNGYIHGENEEQECKILSKDNKQDHEAGHGHSHGHGHGHSHNTGLSQTPKKIATLAWVVVLGDGMHNFCDGLVVGAAFVDNIGGGLSTAVAIMCHEIPHELGDFAVLLKSGMTVKQALGVQAISSVLAYIGMALGILLGNVSETSTWLFALAAGMFLYIALVDLFPEMVNSAAFAKDNRLLHVFLQIVGVSIGVTLMLTIALCEDKLLTALG